MDYQKPNCQVCKSPLTCYKCGDKVCSIVNDKCEVTKDTWVARFGLECHECFNAEVIDLVEGVDYEIIQT